MIYCVEDDDSIRSLELYALSSAGFEVQGFAGGDDFLRALETGRPELVILDVMLPGQSGVELLRQLRTSSDIPVIMATAKGTEFDKIQSLDLGADDYLVKPFGMMEMVSRVKAVLRRYRPQREEQVLRRKGLVMDLAERTVTAEGERVTLTYKEFELLRLFLSAPGVALTRERLLSCVWGTEYVGETRTVDMHVKNLRQKLGPCGGMIETVRNVGYRLEGKP
ncbi:DNA-binding response regulator [Pseudoflavonifractor sp. 60]|uniref:response regulator transcription factor n=1 Tax=Pseudoflavonifractor sp. 60 TaxID=2304576 RepID=UPI00136F5EE2|nr:response regulator transcription factor [Pseudoflavonifractor sp. 60]NBI66363.1 DNA-binding response regulator [Pseudoflavonifractor sp. 60]